MLWKHKHTSYYKPFFRHCLISHLYGLTIYKSSSNKRSTPRVNLNELKAELEEKIVQNNMGIIHTVINDKIGYPIQKRSIVIHTVKPKKHNYDDYEDALEYATDGYKYLLKNKEKSTAKINEVIALWEVALKESNIKNKKARVNSKVTVATYLNLIEAYIWTNKYDTVKKYIRKVSKLKVSRRNKKRLEAYKEFYKSQKDRFEANRLVL